MGKIYQYGCTDCGWEGSHSRDEEPAYSEWLAHLMSDEHRSMAREVARARRERGGF